MDEALSSLPIGSADKPGFRFSPPAKPSENPPESGIVKTPDGRGLVLTIEHGVLLMVAVALTLALCMYKGHLGSGDRHA